VYLSSNHGYPTFGENIENDNGFYNFWIDQIEREGFGVSHPETNYFEKGVWCCPSAQWSERYIRDWRGAFGVIYNPFSYGYNGIGSLFTRSVFDVRTNTSRGFGLGGQYTGDYKYVPVKESEVINPSEMMAIADSLPGNYFLRRMDWNHPSTQQQGLLRHHNRINVVFCDGHVESPTTQFFFEETNDAALVCWNRDHQPHREQLSP